MSHVFLDETIFPDGTRVVDVQAAIQAAWIVDAHTAAEIAKRYDLYDKVCLCCADQPLAAVNPTNVTVAALAALAYQLCIECHYAESMKNIMHVTKRRGTR